MLWKVRKQGLLTHYAYYILLHPPKSTITSSFLQNSGPWSNLKDQKTFFYISFKQKWPNYQKVILCFRTLNIHVAILNKLQSNKLITRGSVSHHHINRAWGFVCFFLLQLDQAIVVFQDKGYSVYITQWFMSMHIHEQEFISLIQDCHKRCLYFI